MKGAGGGRPSKPEAQRRNRAKPTHDLVVLPAEGRAGPAPKPSVPLTTAGRRVWRALWARPEATQWSEADVPALTRMVSLQTDEHAWRDSRLLAEMRQLEDRFGLNPYARRNMKWQVGDSDEEAGNQIAPVRRLRAVDSAS